MILDSLLNAKKITKEEHEVYLLFNSDLGNKWFKANLIASFMDQPNPIGGRGEEYAYADGRRSVFRDIHYIINKIETLISENNVNDD